MCRLSNIHSLKCYTSLHEYDYDDDTIRPDVFDYSFKHTIVFTGTIKQKHLANLRKATQKPISLKFSLNFLGTSCCRGSSRVELVLLSIIN